VASYYYLAASLEPLFLDEEPPLTMAELLAAWAPWLDEDTGRDLRLLLEGRPEAAQAVCIRRWGDIETQIRNAAATQRAARARAEAGPFLRPCRQLDVFLDRAVTEAMAKTQPLERELALDRVRWAALDELARQDPFGLAALAAYAVKLSLAERWNRLTPEAGREALDALLAALPAEAGGPGAAAAPA